MIPLLPPFVRGLGVLAFGGDRFNNFNEKKNTALKKKKKMFGELKLFCFRLISSRILKDTKTRLSRTDK